MSNILSIDDFIPVSANRKGTKEIISVFGSNLAGIHGAGAAHDAKNHHGAIMWLGAGLQGNAYAIPTKCWNVRDTLPIETIRLYTDQFIRIAELTHDIYDYHVWRVGCGLAGLADKDMAALFYNAPDNCYFDTVWLPYLGQSRNYWGTYN